MNVCNECERGLFGGDERITLPIGLIGGRRGIHFVHFGTKCERRLFGEGSCGRDRGRRLLCSNIRRIIGFASVIHSDFARFFFFHRIYFGFCSNIRLGIRTFGFGTKCDRRLGWGLGLGFRV